EVRDRADDLAARFDARNGTTAHADRRRARLERAPLLSALELTLRVRTLEDVTPAAPAPTASTPTAAALPESLTELIVRTRSLDAEGHPDAKARWTRLRTLLDAPDYTHPDDPAVGPLARLRADVLADEAGTAGERDDFARSTALYEQAAAHYEEAGLPGDAALARAAALLATAEKTGEDADPAEKAAALTDAHAAMVRLHEETPDLAPRQEARLLRLRASVLGLRLQTSGNEEHAAPAFAEVDLLHEHAVRHEVVGQVSGARLLRASTHALTGDLPAAVAEADALVERLRADGPAWHLPRTLVLRGQIRLGLRDAEAAHTDLTEALRLAADWPAHATDTGRVHALLAQTCMRLSRPDDALRQLTRSGELDLGGGSRTAALCNYINA
ncbi:hypothetical protein ACWEGQ_39020, partial [Streptomyces seoulensis]